MPVIELPSKEVISFPDNMSREAINQAIQKRLNATADTPEIGADPVYPEQPDLPLGLSTSPVRGDYRPRRDPLRHYRESGISMDGAPPEARYLANLGLLDSANAVRMARASLENTLGNAVGEVEVKRARVRGGEEDNGPIVWRIAGDKQWKFFNAPGISKADLAAAAPHVAQVGTEVVGDVTGAALGVAASSATGFLGAPAAAVIGTTLGGGAVAFATEYKRLKMGQERGLPLTDDEIWEAAYSNGGLAALGAAGLPIAIKTFKIMRGKKVPRFIRDHVSPKQLDEWMKEADAIGDEVPRTLGQMVPDDPKSAESRAVLLNLEEDMSGDVAGDAVREIVRAQNVKASKQLEGITGVKAGMDETELAQVDPYVGGRVKGVVTGPVVNAEQEARKLLQSAEEAAERSAAVVGVAGLPTTTAARSLRVSLTDGREDIFRGLKDEYGAIDERLGEAVGALPDTLTAAAKLKRQLDRRLAQSLLQEDKSLAADFLRGTVKADKDGNIVGLRQFSLLDLQREMSDLKDELRHLDRTGEAKRRRVISTLLDALDVDKKRILAEHDDPALGQALDLLDERWRKAKSDFDRGIVGQILKEKPGSTRDAPIYQMGIKRIIPSILEPDNAKRIVQAFDNPMMADHSYALVDLRRGVMDEFYNRFVNSKDGRITNIAAANHWLDQNREAMETLMSADQRQWMGSAQRWATKLRRVKETDAVLTKTMNRELGMKMRSWDTGAVMDKLWQQGSLDKISQVNRILRAQSPEVHKIFRTASRVHALKTNGVIQWDGSIKNWFVNQEKLEDLLAGEGNNVVTHMRKVLGSDYINDLKSLNTFLLSVRRTPDFNIQDISRAAGATPTFYGPSQFLRVYFAPLSPRGRALTAYKQIKTESTRRALAEAVADPKKLKLMLKLRYMDKWNAAAYSMLGALGMDIMAQADPSTRTQLEAQ